MHPSSSYSFWKNEGKREKNKRNPWFVTFCHHSSYINAMYQARQSSLSNGLPGPRSWSKDRTTLAFPQWAMPGNWRMSAGKTAVDLCWFAMVFFWTMIEAVWPFVIHLCCFLHSQTSSTPAKVPIELGFVDMDAMLCLGSTMFTPRYVPVLLLKTIPWTSHSILHETTWKQH